MGIPGFTLTNQVCQFSYGIPFSFFGASSMHSPFLLAYRFLLFLKA